MAINNTAPFSQYSKVANRQIQPPPARGGTTSQYSGYRPAPITEPTGGMPPPRTMGGFNAPELSGLKHTSVGGIRNMIGSQQTPQMASNNQVPGQVSTQVGDVQRMEDTQAGNFSQVLPQPGSDGRTAFTGAPTGGTGLPVPVGIGGERVGYEGTPPGGTGLAVPEGFGGTPPGGTPGGAWTETTGEITRDGVTTPFSEGSYDRTAYAGDPRSEGDIGRGLTEETAPEWGTEDYQKKMYGLAREQIGGQTQADVEFARTQLGGKGFRAGESGIANKALMNLRRMGSERLGQQSRQLALQGMQARYGQQQDQMNMLMRLYGMDTGAQQERFNPYFQQELNYGGSV